ncbi:hypothetical protein M5K25_018161 [Dendrobium thyrsiflorum]|uniref:Transmembrane protein n=1 Tax=Dendrobium thyrsiflorum TaxID=117978 RepID=A0ABD0UPA3_DENTH
MELHLETPLEALVFRYSATIAGYIWTCLAIFAAGIGLWRFRLLGSASRSAPVPVPKSSSAVSQVIPSPHSTSVPIASKMVVSDCGENEVSGSPTKGRFTTYFIVEEEVVGDDKGEEYEWESYDGRGDGECLDLLDWGWRGDLGWYGYQDWKAINGSVVRLWDGGRRRSARHQRKKVRGLIKAIDEKIEKENPINKKKKGRGHHKEDFHKIILHNGSKAFKGQQLVGG